MLPLVCFFFFGAVHSLCSEPEIQVKSSEYRTLSSVLLPLLSSVSNLAPSQASGNWGLCIFASMEEKGRLGVTLLFQGEWGTDLVVFCASADLERSGLVAAAFLFVFGIHKILFMQKFGWFSQHPCKSHYFVSFVRCYDSHFLHWHERIHIFRL